MTGCLFLSALSKTLVMAAVELVCNCQFFCVSPYFSKAENVPEGKGKTVTVAYVAWDSEIASANVANTRIIKIHIWNMLPINTKEPSQDTRHHGWALCYLFFRSASFNDRTVIHHDDVIGIFDRG